jgi:hypothetical protein
MCVSDNDTLTQSAVLKAPDKDDFLNAQVLKIQGLHYSGELSYHPTAMLPHTDGSQQQNGVDYWETYAPIVSWSLQFVCY